MPAETAANFVTTEAFYAMMVVLGLFSIAVFLGAALFIKVMFGLHLLSHGSLVLYPPCLVARPGPSPNPPP